MYLRAFFNRVNINIMIRRYVVDCKFSLEYVINISNPLHATNFTTIPTFLTTSIGGIHILYGL